MADTLNTLLLKTFDNFLDNFVALIGNDLQ